MQKNIPKQVVDALKKANNVMVTVKRDPTLDELSAAIGLTLILNHMKKHATTVFSGVVPQEIGFLQPETAIENNTDSLRDFIIALDKSKADKLRYKVEDDVVRIYITPYKTYISEDDLNFSQGEFNVDVVVALGIVDKNDFDEAVLAHGSILHDATIIGITKQGSISQIGSINWNDPQASSVSEMIGGIGDQLGEKVFDGQIATSFMTGIIAETDRFRNDNTTPQVLSLSAKLLSHGANQKLIAEELESAMAIPDPMPAMPAPMDIAAQSTPVEEADGMMEIDHAPAVAPQDIQEPAPEVDAMALDVQDEISRALPDVVEEFNAPDPVALTTAPVPRAPQPTVPYGEEPTESIVAPAPPPIANDPQPAPQESHVPQASVDHGGHKVIMPIHDKKSFTRSGEDLIRAAENTPGVGQSSLAPTAPAPQSPAVAANVFSAPQSAPQTPVVGQTLVDLEKQVNSPHQNLPQIQQGPPVDLPPPPPVAAAPVVSPQAQATAAVSPPATPVQAQPAKPMQPLPPPPTPKMNTPQVVAPSTAPSVPPPLMPPPPPSGMPQFYEADGTKGDPLAGVKNAG